MKILTPIQVAKQLKVSESTVRSLISNGQLKSEKINGKRQIKEDDLTEFVIASDGITNKGRPLGSKYR